MKKHVSLFLALILVFSAFFAVPVEAAKAEPNPRAELRAAGVCVHGPADGSRVCKHSYQTRPYNGSQHKRVCTKCGYTFYVNHSFNFTIQSASAHRKYCSCGYSVSNAHTYGYVNTGNTHTKYCKLCGYGAGSESHAFPAGWSCDGSSTHSKRCSICGFTLTQPHALEKRTYWDIDLYYEEWCTSAGCGYRYKTFLVDKLN